MRDTLQPHVRMDRAGHTGHTKTPLAGRAPGLEEAQGDAETKRAVFRCSYWGRVRNCLTSGYGSIVRRIRQVERRDTGLAHTPMPL